jgi:PhnB protein
MTTIEENVREGFHTITPYIIVNEAAELIDFVKQAFGAEELVRASGSAGGIHCEIKIGDSMLMIGGGGAWRGMPTPAALLVYADDVDAIYQNALRAGATSTHEPVEEEYGERDAGVADRFGNKWFISTRRPLEHNPHDLRSIALMLTFHGTPRAIDFLKRAFGAEEVYRAETPDGVVVHAKMRIGDSILVLSEAHGLYQPMRSTLFLYVKDADWWYNRAVKEGAASISQPADQPYGDRVAGVTDPFGNVWYIATHLRNA